MSRTSIRPAWARLSFKEWIRAVMSAPCIACGAAPMDLCVDKSGADINPHEWRHMAAQKEWEWQRAQEIEGVDTEEDLIADEVTRTCPWCGTLFGTVILMEEHEVGCE